jgi:hypothetical protein
VFAVTKTLESQGKNARDAIKRAGAHGIAIALIAVFGLGMTGSPLAAAEVDHPTQLSDWSYSDRVNFTERWNRANALNLMRGPSGAQEYRTITQRAAFYDWFDQIRKVQKHETMWPAAAWVVASQMGNVEDPVRSGVLAARRAAIGRTVDSDRLLQLAKDGNKAIFDDVFPRLKEVFERGLKGDPLRGERATTWDKEVLHREQFDVVQPIYQKYAGSDPNMRGELKDLASGADVLTVSGVAIANALDFKGDILSAQDRYQHGLQVVIPFYRRFEAAIDGSRQRRQQAKPDPSAGGMIQFKSVEQQEKEKRAAAAAAAAVAADEARKAEEKRRREMEKFYAKQKEERERSFREAEDRRRQQAKEMEKVLRQEQEKQQQYWAQQEKQRQEEAKRQKELQERMSAGGRGGGTAGQGASGTGGYIGPPGWVSPGTSGGGPAVPGRP